MERVDFDLKQLPQQVAEFLADLRNARPSDEDVQREFQIGLASGSMNLREPLKASSVEERSQVQCGEIEANYRDLLRMTGGSILRVKDEKMVLLLGIHPRGVMSLPAAAEPDMPVFWFSDPHQTRALVRDAIVRGQTQLPQLASALAALAEQVVDDLTGRVPLDLSGDEVRQLAASGDELAGSFYLLHNQRFGMFFNTLHTAHRADAVEPFVRCLAHAWDLGYEPEMDSVRTSRCIAILEEGLQAFRDWASQRPEARQELTELYGRALWYGPQRLLASYNESVDRRARADFRL